MASATEIPPGRPLPGMKRQDWSEPNVVVGDPRDPLPTPLCPGPPPVATRTQDLDASFGGTTAFDPSRPVWREAYAALRHASDVHLDPYGRLASFVVPDRGGTGSRDAERTWRLTYDDEDRLLEVDMPPDPPGGAPLVRRLDYDAVGNILAVSLPDGQVTRYDYDERDDLTRVTWPDGQTAQYEYDDRDSLAGGTLTAPDGSQQRAEYAIDGLRRIRRLTRLPHWPDRSGAEVTAYGYDDGGGCTAYRA
jgi:YD repeat-containing protein